MIDNDVVYVTVGRKCGKIVAQARQIEELIKSGKKVVLIEPKLTTERMKGMPYSSGLIDLDILTPDRIERADKIINAILKPEGDS